MSNQELDLGAVKDPRYSGETLDKAREVLADGHVALDRVRRTYLVRSPRTERLHEVLPSRDDKGEVTGLRCDCANGKKGGVRARCYHAAAVELLLEERSENHEEEAD